MEFQLNRRDGRLWAVGEMTIYNAASMKEQFFANSQAEAVDVLLDLSQVSELDTCGVQMLLMLQRTAAADERRLTLVAPSAAAREVIGLCGLEALCSESASAKAA